MVSIVFAGRGRYSSFVFSAWCFCVRVMGTWFFLCDLRSLKKKLDCVSRGVFQQLRLSVPLLQKNFTYVVVLTRNVWYNCRRGRRLMDGCLNQSTLVWQCGLATGLTPQWCVIAYCMAMGLCLTIAACYHRITVMSLGLWSCLSMDIAFVVVFVARTLLDSKLMCQLRSHRVQLLVGRYATRKGTRIYHHVLPETLSRLCLAQGRCGHSFDASNMQIFT